MSLTNHKLLTFTLLLTIALSIKAADPAAVYVPKDGTLLPDLKITPGAVRTTNKNEVCRSGSSGQARKVSLRTKQRVYVLYGIDYPHGDPCGPEGCEVDHLISLELGGSNAIQNLWPQPYRKPGAKQKDELENTLHKLVCSGQLSLSDAQWIIRTDWIEGYKKYIGEFQ